MISKEQAGYVHSENADFVCGECVFLKPGAHCAWMGPDMPVSLDNGSCNEWKEGRIYSVPWLEPFYEKANLGYVQNRNGFGCKRCGEFKISREACEVVKRETPGFTPGKITRHGCCNFQKPDHDRGQMTDEELREFFNKPRVLIRIAGAA